MKFINKKIMETIERERKVTYKVYKAEDGTVFNDLDDCKQYENSLIGLLFRKIIAFTKNCTNPFDQDTPHKIAIPQNEEQIDLLNQIWMMYGGKGKDTLLFNYQDINTPILIGFTTDCSGIPDWIWFYKLNNIIQELTENKFEVKIKENEKE